MRSDSELYKLFLSGNQSAYDELMLRHGDSLTVYLNGYLHNWQDSEDLMIDAFARIMVKRPAIREGGFKVYLYKTARNLATRFHFYRAKNKVFSLDDLENDPDEGEPLEKVFQEKENNRILYLCLERIDPELKEALYLIYFENMTYEEASNVMKVSRKRIDKLLQRGKKCMREELGKEGITNAHE